MKSRQSPKTLLLWAVTMGDTSAPSQLRVRPRWLLWKGEIKEQGVLCEEVPELLSEKAETDLVNLRKMQS